ncbi:hypothetical protein GCK72_012427 [Caenorhabditis remanei]|uniref:Uncharacterized protein n=1 Tax=Caenorhabditis remanei TaxID=31234 RepID=A0A6A5GMU3_CAERE|nr:hypothetical protein GCK72_012427 [Caenorhabditis remanei]KAF1755974.1 hypothetical protein GCK72_012427 [Caenorhabditis remanei]
MSQQSPHWIVQVSRESYVWKATLQLFAYLRDLFRPTTVHFDPGDLRYVLKNVKGVGIDATGGLAPKFLLRLCVHMDHMGSHLFDELQILGGRQPKKEHLP